MGKYASLIKYASCFIYDNEKVYKINFEEKSVQTQLRQE